MCVRIVLGLVLFQICWVSASLSAQTFATGFVQEQLLNGLNPSSMTFSPDGRLFIVEKGGRVLTYRDGTLQPEPFLELEVDDFNERGLGGISFHPAFEQNGLFYVYYTPARAGFNRVSRFRANGDFAVPGSEEVLLELDPLLGSIHNGGAMVWLPDTTLIIGVGDGGNGPSAQKTDSFLGKMLRIRDDGSIPSDNPFFETYEGDYRAIYALGLRNPFTVAQQPSSGKIFINDVGGSRYEEVNELVAGGNYGWDIVEGPSGLSNAPPQHVRALHEYDHDSGCAVVGATFYEPSVASFPNEYQGRYFFGDYCLGLIRVLNPVSHEIEGDIASGLDRVIGFAVDDASGDLFYLARGSGDGSTEDNTSSSEGTLWRVRYTGSGAPVVSRQPQDVLLPIGEDAVFEVRASGQPPYSYQWLREGRAILEQTKRKLTLENVELSDDGSEFSVVVENEFGRDTSSLARLTVTTNTRPIPVIISPAPGTTYAAGDLIEFSGAATDEEDGDLEDEQLSWSIDFHHDTHTHPALQAANQFSGQLVVPTIGEVSSNVFYRFTLTATDADGLTGTTNVDVDPRLVDLSFFSEPEGLLVNADGLTDNTPFSVESVVGLERTVYAPPFQELDGEMFVFESWADAGSQESVFYTAGEDPQSFTARYRALAPGNGVGLLGTYHRGTELDAEEVVLERVDASIDFNWKAESPEPGIVPADFFSVAWTGYLRPPVGGEFEFTLSSDDGSRLYINDSLVINAWVNQPYTSRSASFSLEANRPAAIRVEYYDATSAARINLSWDHKLLPSGPIPREYLYVERPRDFDEEPPTALKILPVASFGGTPALFIGNPTTGSVPTPATISMYALNGQLLHTETALLDSGWSYHELSNAPHFPAGMYSVQVRTDKDAVAELVLIAAPR